MTGHQTTMLDTWEIGAPLQILLFQGTRQADAFRKMSALREVLHNAK